MQTADITAMDKTESNTILSSWVYVFSQVVDKAETESCRDVSYTYKFSVSSTKLANQC